MLRATLTEMALLLAADWLHATVLRDAGTPGSNTHRHLSVADHLVEPVKTNRSSDHSTVWTA